MMVVFMPNNLISRCKLTYLGKHMLCGCTPYRQYCVNLLLAVYDFYMRQRQAFSPGTYTSISIYEYGQIPLLLRFAIWRPLEVDWSLVLKARGANCDFVPRALAIYTSDSEHA